MKNHYDKVKAILTKYPKTRDDDMLMYSVYLFQYGGVGADEKFFDVMPKARERGLPSYESVTRSRRKVQEQEPELRGKRYKERQKEEEAYHEYYRDN